MPRFRRNRRRRDRKVVPDSSPLQLTFLPAVTWEARRTFHVRLVTKRPNCKTAANATHLAVSGSSMHRGSSRLCVPQNRDTTASRRKHAFSLDIKAYQAHLKQCRQSSPFDAPGKQRTLTGSRNMVCRSLRRVLPEIATLHLREWGGGRACGYAIMHRVRILSGEVRHLPVLLCQPR